MKHINFITSIVILILFESCISNKQINANPSSSKSVQLDWTMDTFLKPYKDSVKVILKTKTIPEFLSNDCFDYQNKFYWKPKHDPKSFRKEIIFSIEDPKTLKFLLDNNQSISNKECEQLLEHPYGGNPEKMNGQEFTNLELLKTRLKQLGDNPN